MVKLVGMRFFLGSLNRSPLATSNCVRLYMGAIDVSVVDRLELELC